MMESVREEDEGHTAPGERGVGMQVIGGKGLEEGASPTKGEVSVDVEREDFDKEGCHHIDLLREGDNYMRSSQGRKVVPKIVLWVA